MLPAIDEVFLLGNTQRDEKQFWLLLGQVINDFFFVIGGEESVVAGDDFETGMDFGKVSQACVQNVLLGAQQSHASSLAGSAAQCFEGQVNARQAFCFVPSQSQCPDDTGSIRND